MWKWKWGRRTFNWFEYVFAGTRSCVSIVNNVCRSCLWRCVLVGSVCSSAFILGMPLEGGYWEKEFAFFFDTQRTKGNQRRYCDDDVNKFEQIHKMLKIDGYSIAGARRALKKGDDAAPMMKQTVTGQEVLERLSGLLHKDVLESLFLTPKVA